jgi:hypothetical protein
MDNALIGCILGIDFQPEIDVGLDTGILRKITGISQIFGMPIASRKSQKQDSDRKDRFPFKIKIKQNDIPKNRIAGLRPILRCLTDRQPISNHRSQGRRILSTQAALRLPTKVGAAAGVRTIRR